MSIRVALVSMDQGAGEVAKNLSRARSLVSRAREMGATAAIFPEMTLPGYRLDVDDCGEPAQTSTSLRAFGEMAGETGVTTVFGACLISERGAARNSLCVAYPNGESSAVYEKIHPFTFVDEQKTILGGERLGFFSLGDVRVGSAICYDLRFPEPYGIMAPHCDAFITIANWPAPRASHWRALHIARAIENQCYSIGVNRVGSDRIGLKYEPSSIVVAPEGAVLPPLTAEGEIEIFEIDPEVTKAYRARFPTIRDRRGELYARLALGT